MKKRYIVLLLFLLGVFYFVKKEKYDSTFIVYENEKTEFIASKAYEDFFLVKNIPLNDILLEKVIETFIKKNIVMLSEKNMLDFTNILGGGRIIF